jgi:hypothetical protein
MLGHLVHTHGEEEAYRVPRGPFLRWLDKMVSSLLPRRGRR